MQKRIFIIIILLLPSVLATTQIQYSQDNITWTNVTSIAENVNESYQINLQPDTIYHFRGKDLGITNWGYASQRTKDTAEIDDYYLYIIIFISFITLLGLYYYLEDSIFGVISGILVIITAISVFNIGFPNLANEFLKNGLVVILWGIGVYYIIIPSLNIITSWGSES